MSINRGCPAELRERVVGMVLGNERLYGSRWEAVCLVADKLGRSAETVRKWIRRAEVDGGVRVGVSTVERLRVEGLERENRELRRVNEILKAASAFFGAELDRRSKS